MEGGIGGKRQRVCANVCVCGGGGGGLFRVSVCVAEGE